jgi:D-amino-acid dehydrogenase
MRIAVLGAGIIGVTTAYELAADGHEVTVFDRCSSVAAESSFANAGFVAPTYAAPWAAPGMRSRVLRQWFTPDAPWRWAPSLAPAQWRWILRWWSACRPEVYARNRRALFELARLSQQRLRELRQQLALQYERGEGVLVLLRTERDLAVVRRNLEVLHDLGLQAREISAEHCRALEPDLNASEPLAAALQLPNDETGNCRQVAHLLREAAETRHNARFRFGAQVSHIDTRAQRPVLRVHQVAMPTEFATTPTPGRTRGPQTPRSLPFANDGSAPVSDEDFDAVVVCAGVDSPSLLRGLGVHIPLLPMHGYSATFSLRVKEIGPRSAMLDEHHKVAITRLGPRVRVAGGAELGGDPRKMHQGALETLYKVLQDWFPGAAHMAAPQLWKGARPMLPDGPPLIGASGVPNVWLNLGHGGSGWALACGSARLVADQIGQRPPALDLGPFSIRRYAA